MCAVNHERPVHIFPVCVLCVVLLWAGKGTGTPYTIDLERRQKAFYKATRHGTQVVGKGGQRAVQAGQGRVVCAGPAARPPSASGPGVGVQPSQPACQKGKCNPCRGSGSSSSVIKPLSLPRPHTTGRAEKQFQDLQPRKRAAADKKGIAGLPTRAARRHACGGPTTGTQEGASMHAARTTKSAARPSPGPGRLHPSPQARRMQRMQKNQQRTASASGAAAAAAAASSQQRQRQLPCMSRPPELRSS